MKEVLQVDLSSYPSPVVEISSDQNVTVHVIRHCPFPMQFWCHSVMPGDQTFPLENKNKEILDKNIQYLQSFLSSDNLDFQSQLESLNV